MGIQFYNGLSNYSAYEDYKRNIPQVSPEAVKAEETKANENPAPKAEEAAYSSPVVDTRSRTANLEDISLTFNKEDSFDHIGSESSIVSLDMQKAISDMKKDGILEEYQYYVGKSPAVYADADGIVVPKN